jgi:MFS family permease
MTTAATGELTYSGELRANMRPLAAATVGMGFGHQLTFYILSIFMPHLLSTFGWTRAQISAVGVITILAAFTGPLYGRLTDVFGVRRVATLGVVAAMLVFTGFSAMTGNFLQYVLLSIAYTLFIGATTTIVPYSRLIIDRFHRARGLALSIAGCAPAIVGAASAPLISRLIEGHGWRVGYLAVAAEMGLGGLIALFLIPPRSPGVVQTVRSSDRPVRVELAVLVRNPTFQIIFAAVFLCNLTFLVQTSQLALVLVDQGMSATAAALMISVYGIGVAAGRLCSGVVLDRLPPHVGIAGAFGLAAVGLLMLASGAKLTSATVIAVSLLGLSTGSEVIVLPFLTAHFFKLEIYGVVLGLLGGAVAVSASVGALVLSLSLAVTPGFTTFLVSGAVATLAGSLLFWLMGHPRFSVKVAAIPAK